MPAKMNRIYQKESAPDKGTAIVFGAGLRRDGTPTATLRARDRVETAARLYFSSRVEKLLMSGDGQIGGYNEPEAMRRFALSHRNSTSPGLYSFVMPWDWTLLVWRRTIAGSGAVPC